MPSEQDGEPSRAAAAYEYILLRLTEPKDLEHAKVRDEPFLDRSILFNNKQSSINVGRSSKTLSKKLLPAEENAYFDSPVVSREHAEITADLEKGILHVTDVGSMHGTALNGRIIEPSTQEPIKSGDVLRFGVHVARGLDVFFPTECKVDIDMKPLKASYQAPDPIDLSDDDESDCCSSIAQDDSSSCCGQFPHGDTTIVEECTAPALKEAFSVNVYGDIDRDRIMAKNATMRGLVAAVIADRNNESASDDSDYEMEEEEDDDDGESNNSVVGDEEDPKHDDGGDFLDLELNRYKECSGEPLVVRPEFDPAGEDDEDCDVDMGAAINACADAYVNAHALFNPDVDAEADADAGADDGDADANVDGDGDANIDGDGDANVDGDGDASVDAGADTNADFDTDDDAEPECALFGEGAFHTMIQTAASDTSIPAAAVINISSLLNPVSNSSPPRHATTHPSSAAEKDTVPETLATAVTAEIEAWSSQVAINEAMPGDDVYVDVPATSKKRKAEDMLANVAVDLPTKTDSATVPEEKASSVQDAPPATKRAATAVAVSAAKKHKGVVWAVAEKVGIAALGGAVVLGSLIYTAPSF